MRVWELRGFRFFGKRIYKRAAQKFDRENVNTLENCEVRLFLLQLDFRVANT